MEDDYRVVRRHIEAVVPGSTDYEERISHAGGFRLPHGPHDVRVFTTGSTKANVIGKDLWWPPLPPGRLLLQTLRSHGEVVDLVSEFSDGVERRAEEFRVVTYDTARGCAAAYYPETNVLVPLDSNADRSNTPTSKSVVIRLERRGQAAVSPS